MMWRWFRSLFAWREVFETGIWSYQENAMTGARRVDRIAVGGYQPIDHAWLERRESFRPTTPPPSPKK